MRELFGLFQLEVQSSVVYDVPLTVNRVYLSLLVMVNLHPLAVSITHVLDGGLAVDGHELVRQQEEIVHHQRNRRVVIDHSPPHNLQNTITCNIPVPRILSFLVFFLENR